MEQEHYYGCASCEHAAMYKGFHIGCLLGVYLNERHPTNDGGWACEKYKEKKPNIKEQIAVLKEVALEYSGKTIDNIIKQMEARINIVISDEGSNISGMKHMSGDIEKRKEVVV